MRFGIFTIALLFILNCGHPYSNAIHTPSPVSTLQASSITEDYELFLQVEDRDYYFNENIPIRLKFINKFKYPVMVEDPQDYFNGIYNSTEVVGEYYINVGDSDPAHFGATARKIKIEPGDSIIYTYNINQKIILNKHNYAIISVSCDFYAYPYFDRWKHLTHTTKTKFSVEPHSIYSIVWDNNLDLFIPIFKHR